MDIGLTPLNILSVMVLKYFNFYFRLKFYLIHTILLGFVSLEVFVIWFPGRQGLLRRVWNSWIPIPTGVGLTLLGVLQWRRLERKRKRNLGIIDVAEDWEVNLSFLILLIFYLIFI